MISQLSVSAFRLAASERSHSSACSTVSFLSTSTCGHHGQCRLEGGGKVCTSAQCCLDSIPLISLGFLQSILEGSSRHAATKSNRFMHERQMNATTETEINYANMLQFGYLLLSASFLMAASICIHSASSACRIVSSTWLHSSASDFLLKLSILSFSSSLAFDHAVFHLPHGSFLCPLEVSHSLLWSADRIFSGFVAHT